MKSYDILSNCQYAYRKARNTELAVMNLVDKSIDNFDKKSYHI